MVLPARYDHAFKGKVIIHEMDACKGCSGFTHGARNGVCEIYVVRSGNWIESVVIRHELAHCNGWPANHPPCFALRRSAAGGNPARQ